MAMISCPECGKSVSDRAASCPECGCPINVNTNVPVQQNTDDLEKLIVLARRARVGEDSKNARRYYNQILDKAPGNWEAIFYTVYYEARECKIMDIAPAANSVANCIYSTFSAINDLEDENEKKQALDTVIGSATIIAIMLANGARNHYSEYSTTTNAYSECKHRVTAAANIYGEIENNLETVFPDEKERLAEFRKSYIDFVENGDVEWGSAIVERLKDAIAEYSPEYREELRLEREREDLLAKIRQVELNIDSLVTERKAPAAGCGVFFLVVGSVMLFLGMGLASLDGGSWPIWVGLLEAAIAIPFFKKSPSEEVVQANMLRKEELLKEKRELQDKLNSLE